MSPSKQARDRPDSGERKAAAMLAQAGLRRTHRRVRLLALLLQATRPMSHLEIHEALGRDQADRVSVYRALDAFAEKGLVHRAYVDGRTWLYETADRCAEDQCHPHFTCRACGAVRCLVNVAVPVVKAIGHGYLAERQQVHISGVCPECRGGEAGS